MKAKYVIAVLALVVLAVLLFVGRASPVAKAGGGEIDYGPMAAQLPSNGEMYGWIKDLSEIGNQNDYGYRMPGSAEDHEASNYILEKFQEFGLQDTFLEPVSAELSLPDSWSLTLQPGEQEEEVIPSYFGHYAAFTPPEGITAEMVYVGQGSAAEFAAKNVAGKIVVVDVIAPGWPTSMFEAMSLFTYDPDNTLPGDMAVENWPPINLRSSYELAEAYGAAGYVAILTFTVNDNNQWYADGQWEGFFFGSIPTLLVSPNDGDYLRSLLASGPVIANMVLTGTNETGVAYNIYGFLPGKTDEIIVISSHHDGWATNDGSGTAVVMALAKYFGQLPKESRERTFMFVFVGSHFGKNEPWTNSLMYSLLPKVVAANTIEMIAKQYKIIDGKYVETGLISPQGFGITTKNPYLVSLVSEAIIKYDLDRSIVLPLFHGEGGKWARAGVPTIERIAENAPQFTNDDTPNTVQVDALKPTAAAFIDIIKRIDATPADLLK